MRIQNIEKIAIYNWKTAKIAWGLYWPPPPNEPNKFLDPSPPPSESNNFLDTPPLPSEISKYQKIAIYNWKTAKIAWPDIDHLPSSEPEKIATP